MPSKPSSAHARRASTVDLTPRGAGDELQQQAGEAHVPLTSNQGLVLSDNQNSVRAYDRGPTLLEDFLLREKITSFDHERIPERIVHARGSGAHGVFELSHSLKSVTTAKVLTEVGQQVPVFCRFSTVAGGSGSVDTPRDVRGFAVKFYTEQGNWDLVGNNIPVFFIQDAMKFPDLIHAVKMEPDRGFPQAASAHDTFWDFISLMPESMHMVMWAMSDRTLPRSLRMMEGFGIHSFRLVNAQGASTFVKFHWRPALGLQSTVWDEAVKLAGADPDFHRRDLYEAIQAGQYPAWDLAVQLFSEDEAAGFPFDHLDATKLIPEELVPLQVIGRMTLNRWPDNFFAETEQVAFCPSHILPGMDFSNDPLLQGRLFSYLDTQLSRLGSPNFHQLPINAPKCPFANLQRDGHMQHRVPSGRVAYEPSSLDPASPRASLATGLHSFAAPANDGGKGRVRPESFADHYSQARQFYLSQTEVERFHMASALVFELSKVQTEAIRLRMLSHLLLIDELLAHSVAEGLGVGTLPAPAVAAVAPGDAPESPPLSLVANMKATLQGRCVGLLIDEGSDAGMVAQLRSACEQAGATVKIVARRVGSITLSDATQVRVDGQLAGTPSVVFDAVAVVVSKSGAASLLKLAAAQEFLRDAYGHLKAMAGCPAGRALFEALDLAADEGIVEAGDPAAFVKAATTRYWSRELALRPL
jgi:catalase